MSRSWVAPHPHIHDRTFNDIEVAMVPHAEHSFDEGNQRSILAK